MRGTSDHLGIHAGLLVHDVQVTDPLAFAEYLPGLSVTHEPEPEPVEVRVATPDDDEDLGRLVAGTSDAPRLTARLRADIVDPDRAVLVAQDRASGRVLGYGRAGFRTPPDSAPPNVVPAGWYLLGLVVDPRERRRGIGTELTAARTRWIWERADEAWFFANARNLVSLELHARLGYREVTRDLWVPGVTFAGGVGVLCCATPP